ncbi:uromodulin-like [Ambystoma mexicanum]|uniref:uromodulin-like n=1 Tax=Ambystoma mexicanum TaxID=8296 RepID=UPI0037E8DE1B
MDGYVGDGLRCTNISHCSDSSCCPPTYTWDPTHHCCSSTNFCADPSLNSCGPKETCEMVYDHYICTGSERNNSPLLNCNGQTCSAGQDCKRYADGSVRCMDPCREHYDWDSYWRADNHSTGDRLSDDRNFHGWVHFVGQSGSRMPEQCVKSLQCGTGSPVILKGGHPTMEEGIVLRHGAYGSKCSTTAQIYVKACPGNFFTYKFMGLFFPGFGYCTDPNTVAVPACSPGCAQDEECLWAMDSWGCYCKAGVTVPPGPIHATVSCGGNKLMASLSRCKLEALGLQSSTAHFADPACVGQRGYGGTLSTINVVSGFMQCGTSAVRTNEMQVSFSNVIKLTAANGHAEDNMNISVSCNRTLNMQLSSELSGNAVESALAVMVPNLGQLTLKLSLFKNVQFTEPFQQDELAVPRGLPVYVGAYIQDAIGVPAVVLMRNCFATSSGNSEDTKKHFFIRNRCPDSADLSVQMEGQTEPYQAGFKTLLFQESWGFENMHLHCALQLCTSANKSDCTPVCPALDAPADFTNLLTIGPIRRAGVSDLVPKVTCDLEGIEVSIPQSVLDGLGYNTITLPQTQDSHCVGSPGSEIPALVSISTRFLNGECGLQFTGNNDQVTISSTLRLAVQHDGSISNMSQAIPFSCSFQLKKFGVSSIVVASRGDRYTAGISVYSDAAYTVPDPHLAAANFVPGSTLYVKVALTSPSDPLVALVLYSCNATITLPAITEIHLIEHGTPVAESLITTIIENGNSSQARFSFEVSEDLHRAEEFSLYCQVFLCVKSGGDCLRSQNRKRRSALSNDGAEDWVVSHSTYRRIRS